MKRAAPYILFAALTLLVFWKFLLLGYSTYGVRAIQAHLGQPANQVRPWLSTSGNHFRASDDIMLFPPLYRVYNEGLKEGELRLWNPHFFCGYPIYANTMVHPFYPPHLVLHAALTPRTAHGASLMLHFFFAGVAMFLCLRTLGRSDAAAAAGGVIWMLVGYHAAWFSMGLLLGTSVFGPLALMWLHQGLRRKGLSRALPAGIAMGMAFLGSHPQHAPLLFLFFTAWLLFEILRDRGNRGFVARFSTLFAAVAIGTGLAELLARLDSIAHGFRSAAEDPTYLVAGAGETLRHLLGTALGKVSFMEGPLEIEYCTYVGLAALALAITGAVRGFRDPLLRFTAIFASATLVVSFSRPLDPLLGHLPLLNLSPPYRWLSVFAFCVPLLAARGIDAWREGRVPLPTVAVLTLLLVFGVGLKGIFDGPAVETLVGFALVIAAASCAHMKAVKAAVPLIFAAILFELVPYFLAFNRHSDPSVLDRTPEALLDLQKREKNAPWRATGGLWGRFDRKYAQAEIHTGNCTLAVFGVENVAGFDAIPPKRHVAFCRRAGGKIMSGGRITYIADPDAPLLKLAGLEYLLLPSDFRAPQQFRAVRDHGNVKLYKRIESAPRAWVAERVLAVIDAETAARFVTDDLRSVVLESSSPVSSPEGPVAYTIDWEHRTPDRVSLRVTCSRDAFLVLADTYDPGWEATVNGNPVEIHPANIAFRAVRVPKGSSEVEFRFRPPSARLGLTGSTLTLLLALTLGTLMRRRTS